MHGAVGVHLLQPHQQALHQALSVLQLDELESHLAPDADDNGIREQTGILHLLNAHHLLQKVTHERYGNRQRRAGISITYLGITRQKAKPNNCPQE